MGPARRTSRSHKASEPSSPAHFLAPRDACNSDEGVLRPGSADLATRGPTRMSDSDAGRGLRRDARWGRVRRTCGEACQAVEERGNGGKGGRTLATWAATDSASRASRAETRQPADMSSRDVSTDREVSLITRRLAVARTGPTRAVPGVDGPPSVNRHACVCIRIHTDTRIMHV